MNWINWRGVTKRLGRAVPEVTLVGYPLHSTGRGQHLRAILRAMLAADLRPRVFDLTPGMTEEISAGPMEAYLTRNVEPGGIRLFHCNGDQAVGAIEALNAQQAGLFASGYNIIFPAWELPRYPVVWAKALDRYDEVWAATAFVHEALRNCVSTRLSHVHNACQPKIDVPLSRAHFGLRDDDYVVLSFFDYWSYAARKNPLATIEAFRIAAAARPDKPLRFVLKTNHSDGGFADQEVRRAIAELGQAAVLIDRTTTDNEIKNLINVSDCFLSLHRSEGFGRGPAEAMFFGKPVVATGWSGNMDYMTSENSFPVGFRLIAVEPGAYPESDGQVWADPDPAKAARALIALVDDPALGARMGARAARDMRRNFGDGVLGRAYAARFRAIAGTRQTQGSWPA